MIYFRFFAFLCIFIYIYIYLFFLFYIYLYIYLCIYLFLILAALAFHKRQASVFLLVSVGRSYYFTSCATFVAYNRYLYLVYLKKVPFCNFYGC
ncbi:hypothetical protein PO909_029325 [Leuciscus waleckii]